MNYNLIAQQYEEDVLSGRIPSGQLLRLAIQRQRDDLLHGHERGLYFDHQAGELIVDFCRILNLSPADPQYETVLEKIDRTSDPEERRELEELLASIPSGGFELAPWQVWELYVFYGWRRKGGYRRFRFKYKSVARKNGKTPLESAQILFHLTVEDLFRAEAYVSATKESQAQIAFDDAKFMLEFSPDLQECLSSSATTISNSDNKSKFQFLTSNPKTADGTRPSFAVIDEYHEFDNDDMIGKLVTGMIHRKQPVLNIVTTRGTDKSKPCFQAEYKVYIPILKGIVKDDATFVLIFSLDETDNWDDPANWIKANPMIGYILRLEDLIEAYKKAKIQGPEHIIKFKTLNLNMWCDAPKTWIEDHIYWANGHGTADRDAKLEEFTNKRCYGGLDLAKRDDFCSFALVFDDQEAEIGDDGQKIEQFDAFWWHFIPEETVRKRIENGLSSLREWIDSGYIIVTEGTITDYNVVFDHILALTKLFQIDAIGYDVHNIGNLATNLTDEGVNMLMVPQTINEVSEPTKLLKYSILQGRFNHGFDPVMRWQVANAVEISGNNDCIRLTKDSKRAKEKIDGLAAAINALRVYQDGKTTESNIYDQRGLLDLNDYMD